ncbi:MAG: DUF4876 domain-containing protein [Muribaculaceae bacterium]|nr:DUF4876 domain-containing protein [Muribaculaceae bacterium]
MTAKNISLTLTATAMFCMLASCSDNEEPSVISAEVDIQLPDGIYSADLLSPRFEIYNVSTGRYSQAQYNPDAPTRISLIPGLYSISFAAKAMLTNGAQAEVSGTSGNISITSSVNTVEIKAYSVVPTDDLIISELFYTGTLQTSGDQYNGDQYIKLFNNTDHVVYADGLTFFESTFLTTQKFVYTPDIMPSAMSVQALYTIPGSGTDHPVEPGEEILISDIAIDHRAINPNSFDLSHSDFEWYDESSNPKYSDIDNPAVENLDKWYCYTNTIWQLHNRGFKAYGIARIPITRDEYLGKYYYTCEYEQVTPAGTFPMSKSSYALPNDWIIDVVNTSVESEYMWNLCIPSLDSGWTYCGNMANDKNRYFRAVRRAVAYTGDDGRIHLQDTNNSSADFIPDCTPSEIELQGTAKIYEK